MTRTGEPPWCLDNLDVRLACIPSVGDEIALQVGSDELHVRVESIVHSVTPASLNVDASHCIDIFVSFRGGPKW